MSLSYVYIKRLISLYGLFGFRVLSEVPATCFLAVCGYVVFLGTHTSKREVSPSLRVLYSPNPHSTVRALQLPNEIPFRMFGLCVSRLSIFSLVFPHPALLARVPPSLCLLRVCLFSPTNGWDLPRDVTWAAPSCRGRGDVAL